MKNTTKKVESAFKGEVLLASPGKILEELRSRIPDSIKCLDDCGACCAHVAWSRYEWQQIPYEIRFGDFDPFSFQCPFLKNYRCSVHEHRPIACRIFGVVQTMACPKGVPATEYMTIEAAEELLLVYKKYFFKGSNHEQKQK